MDGNGWQGGSGITLRPIANDCHNGSITITNHCHRLPRDCQGIATDCQHIWIAIDCHWLPTSIAIDCHRLPHIEPPHVVFWLPSIATDCLTGLPLIAIDYETCMPKKLFYFVFLKTQSQSKWKPTGRGGVPVEKISLWTVHTHAGLCSPRSSRIQHTYHRTHTHTHTRTHTKVLCKPHTILLVHNNK